VEAQPIDLFVDLFYPLVVLRLHAHSPFNDRRHHQGGRSRRKGWNRPRHSVTDMPVRRQGRRTALGFVVRVHEEIRHGTGVDPYDSSLHTTG
jgi:hypothetical protein